MKTKDKKLIYSVLGAILFIVIIIAGISFFTTDSDNIYLTLYSPIDNYEKVIKVQKGVDVCNNLEEHTIDGYEFIGWYYDNDLINKVEKGSTFSSSQILKAGYSKIIIKDENGFNVDLDDIKGYKNLTIRTKNSTLTYNDLEEILNNDIVYLDLENTKIEDNVIKEFCFYNKTNLRKILLPFNTIEICEGAFKNCYNLESIVINDSLKILSKEAFYNCKSITEINLENVEIIRNYAFSGCVKLKELSFGKNLKTIDEYSFYNSHIENVKINSLNEKFIINQNILYTIDYKQLIKAFSNIESSVVVNDNVETINKNAFENNENLKEITMPLALKEIKDYAFSNCKNFSQVIFQDNTHYELNKGVFYNCCNLRQIKFTVGLSHLGDECFKNCENLKTIEFNNSTNLDVSNLTTIGNNCFENCKNLEFFVMPDSVEYIGKELFSECRNILIVNLSSRIKSIPNKTFYNNTKLTKVVATSNIESIGDSAFEGCKKLENVSTLNDVNYLGNKSFKNCESIEEILFNNLEIIYEESFYNCVNLKTVSLEKVKELNKRCFYGCQSLVSFNIENTIVNIDSTSFENCEKLKEFMSKDNEKYSVFDGVLYDKDLKNIICYPQGKTDETFIIKSSVENINVDSFYLNKYISNIIVEEGNHIFSSYNGVLYSFDLTELYRYPINKTEKEAEVLSTVKVIKSKAFSNNSNLESLVINNNVENIEMSALNNLCSLKSLKIPFIGSNKDENKFLGYIFGSNSYLTNYSFVPESLKNIEITNDTYVSKYSFYNLDSIECIKYNCNVKLIENYAFYGNKNLKEIYFLGALELIKEKAFIDNSNLKILTFSFNNELEIENNNFQGLNYSLEINILNNNQHVSYSDRSDLKNKFIKVYKKAENWKWLF